MRCKKTIMFKWIRLKNHTRSIDPFNIPMNPSTKTLTIFKFSLWAAFVFFSATLHAQTAGCSNAAGGQLTVSIACNPVAFNTSDNTNWWTGAGTWGNCDELFGDAWMWFDAAGTTTTITYDPVVEDAVLTLFQGACNASGPSVACADNGGYGGIESITLTTVVGTRYHVRIENYWGNTDMAGTICVTTPVLLGFGAEGLTVRCVNNVPLLEWQATEMNTIDHSVIEKSTDGRHWTNIATLYNGEYRNGKTYFSYRDETNQEAQSYYRVRQYLLTGRDQLSNIVSTHCTTENSLFKLYPNPSNGLMKLEYESDAAVPFQLFDLHGRLVYTQLLERSPGRKIIQIKATTVPPGMYLYKLVLDKEVKTGRIVIQK